jgi:excisionase family DNA binding protein
LLFMDLQSDWPREPLSVSEAARQLGVCARTLRRYIASDRIRHHRLPSGHYRIPPEAIDEFWATNAKARAPAPLHDRDEGRRRTGSRRPAARRAASLGREQPHSYDLSPEHLAQLRERVSANPSR